MSSTYLVASRPRRPCSFSRLCTMPLPNDPEHVYDVVIVGGAIAGMATALGLARRGITNICLLEKATQLQPVGASIALFSNGIKALEYLSPDVAERVRESCIPIETMMLKDLDGNILHEKKPLTAKGVNYLVWYLLQQYLSEGLPEGVLKMGHAMDSFEVGSDGIVTLSASSSSAAAASETITIRTRILVGADGIHSRIREQLFGPTPKHYHEKLMYRAALPMNLIDSENRPPRGINISVQGDEPGKLFSYRETARDILTVTSMARFDEKRSGAMQFDIIPTLSSQDKKDLMRQAFCGYPREVQNILDNIPADSVHVDAIRDIDVVENASKGHVILIGDAAHAMSPSLGQGANQGLEDACILVHGLSKLFTGTNTNVEPASITPALAEVWQKRYDRVSIIHAASRARSAENNKSSKTAPVDMKSIELKEVLRKIDEWDVPVDTCTTTVKQ